MRTIFCFLLLLCSPGLGASKALEGEWKLVEMIYRESSIGLPNPDLNMRWNFFTNGTSRLYWDRGSEDFCERFANFSVKGDFLEESVFAINPENAVDCKSDPDMQIGRKTKTQIKFIQEKLQIYFQLGDEELIYVLKKI